MPAADLFYAGVSQSRKLTKVNSAVKLKLLALPVAVALSILIAVVFSGGFAAANGSPQTQSKTRGVATDQNTKAQVASELNGHYFALVIGINNYQHLPKLSTAVQDAQALSAILHDQYGFQTTLLVDATRDQITKAMNDYRHNLDENASLLIYYAGHGMYDKDADKAYWLPVDAERDDNSHWIMADDITTEVKVIPARHVLIISDSCYSGGMTREIAPSFTQQERDRFLEKMVLGRSRTLMSSGALEPVSDGGGGGHSVFTGALIKALSTSSDEVFSAGGLFDQYVQVSVAGRSDQTPQYIPIRNSGHDFGDFVFVRSGKAPAPAATRKTAHTQEPAPLQTPPAQSRQPAALQQADNPPPATPSASAVASLGGCWLWFNKTSLIVRSDGTATDGPFVAHWQLADPARQVFTITWPRSVDTITLTPDGLRLSGANQYGIPVSATRTSGGKFGAVTGMVNIVGTWQWYNGVTVTIDKNGTLQGGTVTAQWKLMDPLRRTYNLIWPEPVDTLTLSADGLHLTGGNQYGFSTGGTKVAATCPGAY
ncbi:MAG: caspase family protein [Candidatus Acidiferrales bacterium]